MVTRAIIDLRSHTVTHPDGNMRQAMAVADMRDDQFGEDPTTNLLQERGDAMRQTGNYAAAGFHALVHDLDRLADDHANARVLADRLRRSARVVLDPLADGRSQVRPTTTPILRMARRRARRSALLSRPLKRSSILRWWSIASRS